MPNKARNPPINTPEISGDGIFDREEKILNFVKHCDDHLDMKTKVPQREFNFSSEPFRLVPESGIDTDHQCAQENQRQQDKAGAEKAQWWFEQMRKAVENSR